MGALLATPTTTRESFLFPVRTMLGCRTDFESEAFVREFFAHTLAGFGPDRWERYAAHRDLVVHYATRFASAFGAAAWGEMLGRWHDLGKLSDEWQDYLLSHADPDASEENVFILII